MDISILKPIPDSELENYREKMQNYLDEFLLSSDVAELELVNFWARFFESIPREDDRLYRDFFAQKFAFLAWTNLFSLDSKIIFSVLVPRFILPGLLCGVDIRDSLIRYLRLIKNNQEDIESTYKSLRQAFLGSQEILFDEVDGARYHAVSDYIKSVMAFQNKPEESLERANFLAKTKKRLMAVYDFSFLNVDADTVSARLLGLTVFFLGVSPDKIYYLSDAYVHSEEYDLISQNLEKKQKASSSKDYFDAFDALPSRSTNYRQIQTMVNERFLLNSDGSYQNPEGLISFLSSLADERGDENIRDLFIFDDASGDFVWNEELLNS